MEIFRAGQAICGISTLYGTQDRFAHNASSQCADNILVRGKLAKGYGINAVTVCRGVYRADGTGVTIVRHTSQFAELGFLERCIGEHNAVRYDFDLTIPDAETESVRYDCGTYQMILAEVNYDCGVTLHVSAASRSASYDQIVALLQNVYPTGHTPETAE